MYRVYLCDFWLCVRATALCLIMITRNASVLISNYWHKFCAIRTLCGHVMMMIKRGGIHSHSHTCIGIFLQSTFSLSLPLSLSPSLSPCLPTTFSFSLSLPLSIPNVITILNGSCMRYMFNRSLIDIYFVPLLLLSPTAARVALSLFRSHIYFNCNNLWRMHCIYLHNISAVWLGRSLALYLLFHCVRLWFSRSIYRKYNK